MKNALWALAVQVIFLETKKSDTQIFQWTIQLSWQLFRAPDRTKYTNKHKSDLPTGNCAKIYTKCPLELMVMRNKNFLDPVTRIFPEGRTTVTL
jgi:hypothetical protein